MHCDVQLLARVEVGGDERADLHVGVPRASRHAGDQRHLLRDLETERHVERERCRVEGVLEQPDALGPRGPLQHGLHHQLAPDAGCLPGGVDGDRPDAADRAALVEEVRADEPRPLRSATTPQIEECSAKAATRSRAESTVGEVPREAVAVSDAGEGIERDVGRRVDVGNLDRPKVDSSLAHGIAPFD